MATKRIASPSKRRTSSRRHRCVALAVGLMLGVAACGGDDGTGNDSTDASSSAVSVTSATATSGSTTDEATTTSVQSTSSASRRTSATSASSTKDAGGTRAVRAYFLREEKVGPVAVSVSGSGVAAGAMIALLQGPGPAERDLGFTTTIPAGTRLLGVRIVDRVATVDLSAEFTSGGGSASMMGRVAQVVFTLTQFPTVSSVLFETDGAPLTTLGGEGLLIGDPQTRDDWEGQSPAILVESPLPFQRVSSPLRISGTANTFEAVFRINITDGEGLIVYDEVAMATSGTGTRGTFDVTARFEVPRPGLGSVIVFVNSPKDGSPVNIVEIPVTVGS